MTTAALDYWTTRHVTAPAGWAGRYWQSQAAPHREVLMAALAGLVPFGSVYEVGCNAGPNLARIGARWPEVTLGGCDLNLVALAEARARLGWGVRLDHGNLCLVLARQAPRSVDVVLSCYALAYVAPAALDEVLADLRRVARRAVVLAEPQGDGGQVLGLPYEEWAHDYARRWSGARRLPVDPPADRLNVVLVEEIA